MLYFYRDRRVFISIISKVDDYDLKLAIVKWDSRITTQKKLPLDGNSIPNLNISCQNPLRLWGWESGRYDLQIITFQRFRNAMFIADIGPREEMGSGFASDACTCLSSIQHRACSWRLTVERMYNDKVHLQVARTPNSQVQPWVQSIDPEQI